MLSARRNRKRTLASSNAQIVKARTLTFDRVVLRPYRNDDALLLYEAAIESRDTVGRWMPWCHGRYAMTDSVALVESCAESANRASGNATPSTRCMRYPHSLSRRFG
jgi:hypothetical protein